MAESNRNGDAPPSADRTPTVNALAGRPTTTAMIIAIRAAGVSSRALAAVARLRASRRSRVD
jgi:hypothetical protein